MKRIFLISAFLTFTINCVNAQQAGNPKDTEAWTPVPKLVELKNSLAEIQQAPSDAIILFDGKNLDAKSNEARVWYTGSTRSKKNLFLLGTTHKYSFPLAQIYNTYMENINEQ